MKPLLSYNCLSNIKLLQLLSFILNMDCVQLTANMIAAFSGVQVLFLFAKLFSVCLVQQDLYAFFFFLQVWILIAEIRHRSLASRLNYREY